MLLLVFSFFSWRAGSSRLLTLRWALHGSAPWLHGCWCRLTICGGELLSPTCKGGSPAGDLSRSRLHADILHFIFLLNIGIGRFDCIWRREPARALMCRASEGSLSSAMRRMSPTQACWFQAH